MNQQQSFLEQDTVNQDDLVERLECIHVLSESSDQYEAIVKDRFTGEHYLHRGDRHLNVPAGGAEEIYHALLPLTSDDVIALMQNEMRLPYPDAWQKTYLRNGPDGFFVWFDPEMTVQHAADEQFGAELFEKMVALKRAGTYDAASIQAFLSDVDRLKKDFQ